jgi:hypothetical protein
VSELTIVPAQGNKPGVAADDGKPLGHVADAGGDKAPPKRKGRGKGNKADADPNPAKDDAAPANTSIKKVTARIGKLAGNKLTVNPGGKAMQIELTDDATINIALTDPKLIVAGAMIKVHGQAIENNNGKVCNADDITVTLVSPLTGKRRPVRLETKPKPAAEQDDGAVPAAKENAKPDAEGDGQ